MLLPECSWEINVLLIGVWSASLRVDYSQRTTYLHFVPIAAAVIHTHDETGQQRRLSLRQFNTYPANPPDATEMLHVLFKSLDPGSIVVRKQCTSKFAPHPAG